MGEKKTLSPSLELARKDEAPALPEECFVIMPISDRPGYDSGHFTKVYEDVFKPACTSAGYNATRADDVKESNLIHLDILKRVVHSPMAICDLSSRNPNVLFELGLRQAFDKPTILVKDKETPEIFDIAPIRYTPYRQSLRYREVIEDQQAIAQALLATKGALGQEHNVNSLIKLLELAGPAAINENRKSDPQDYFQILMAEISQLKHEVRFGRVVGSKRLAPIRVPTAPPDMVVKQLRDRIKNVENLIKNNAPENIYRLHLGEALAYGEDALRDYSARADPEASVQMQLIMQYLDSLRAIQEMV
ncbi:hypothetical protein [Duganella fentianensis]|uniref:hypothetical protein n=1 Tax=Duganella fentianensis TaxID=2692177 RepID=UPI0032B1091F